VTRAPRRAAAPPGPRWLAGVPGARDPVVVVLLLIAFFSAISGKPLDGLLMLLVAAGLAWDARARRRRARPAPSGTGRAGRIPGWPHPGLAGAGAAGPDEPAGLPPAGLPAGVAPAGAGGGLAPAGAGSGLPPAGAGSEPGAGGRACRDGACRDVAAEVARHGRGILAAAGVAGGAGYALVVGSFARFSWLATAAVAGLGALVLLIGWQGPVRPRPVPGRLPLPGTALWGGVLAAGGLWELWSLFQQPSLSQTSYAHPTLSALTDPVLAGPPGRALVLAWWLLLGWYLIRR